MPNETTAEKFPLATLFLTASNADESATLCSQLANDCRSTQRQVETALEARPRWLALAETAWAGAFEVDRTRACQFHGVPSMWR
jgi:hypothetical protein